MARLSSSASDSTHSVAGFPLTHNLVEGILALHDPALRMLYDLKVGSYYAYVHYAGLKSLVIDICTMRFRLDARPTYQPRREGTWP